MKLLLLMFLFIPFKVFAYCPPCVCTESNSQSLTSDYLYSQIAVLNGYIIPDIDAAIEQAKNTLEATKKAYASILNTEQLSLSILSDQAQMADLVEKIALKKELEAKLKINELKTKIATQEIKITESVKK